jgi:hypothetical protein
MPRPADSHAAPVLTPRAEALPEVSKAKHCTCWGGPGLPDTPCTPATCDLECKACAFAEEPFLTRQDLRFLDTGAGPTADAIRRLWAAKDIPKGGPPGRPRERRAWCERGHDRVPGQPCKPCNAEAVAKRRARAREGAAT